MDRRGRTSATSPTGTSSGNSNPTRGDYVSPHLFRQFAAGPVACGELFSWRDQPLVPGSETGATGYCHSSVTRALFCHPFDSPSSSTDRSRSAGSSPASSITRPGRRIDLAGRLRSWWMMRKQKLTFRSFAAAVTGSRSPSICQAPHGRMKSARLIGATRLRVVAISAFPINRLSPTIFPDTPRSG